MTDAAVHLWGRRIGAVSWDPERDAGVFQYEPRFASAGIELAPFAMPVRESPYVFQALGRNTGFKGLPGLLADSLPDRFGNRLIDAWLASRGLDAEAFNPVERLCYVGSRGMGALEYRPATSPAHRPGVLDIAELTELAGQALSSRRRLRGRLGHGGGRAALEDILAVGTSAGGARAKAVLAWNSRTGEFRSGQAAAGEGFEHWILKFDGVTDYPTAELGDPQGYGTIEYAYHLMALDAGIEMSECRLHHEGGRSHFMTRRFDRPAAGGKLHVQSLAALRHFDFHQPGAYAYEQAMETIARLGLDAEAAGQQFRRAAFNIVARNQDDHVKNIAFMMDRSGAWRLSPAYDLVYAYNPAGPWTGRHQMSLAGKRQGFEHGDLLRFAATSGIEAAVARQMVEEVLSAVAGWPSRAAEAGVSPRDIRRIGAVHRLDAMRPASVA